MDDSEIEKASIDSDLRPSKLSLWFSQWWHQPPNIWYRRRLRIVLLLTGVCALLSLNQVLTDFDNFIPPEAARRVKASWGPSAAMDTSIPPTPMPSSPPPWLVETASLIGQVYELFIKMRYLPPGSIAYPPHISPPINTHYAHSLGLDRQAIELLQLLPYVTGETAWGGGGEQEFILGGTFADFRDEGTLAQSRDPLYGSPEGSDWADENGPYMRPWYVALNQLGNHGTIMVLDLKSRHLWMEDQEGPWTTDPELRDAAGEHHPISKNRNAFENVPSRPVDVVLKDLMRKFVELEWVPGMPSPGSRDWSAYTYKRLYLEHGWPDNFNGTAFDIARQAVEDEKSALKELVMTPRPTESG